MPAKNNARFARLVEDAFSALGVTQAAFHGELGGPSDTTLRKIIDQEPVGISVRTLTALDRAFQWTPGSAARALAGGDPTPLLPPKMQVPILPRNAHNAPVLGAVDVALGIHPNVKGAGDAMPASDRQLLLSARNKLLKVGTRDDGFTDDETRVLTKFIEDDELATLHARLDWLPRAEQLKVSQLVNELQLEVEQRWVADGYNNESEELPDYAQPNPLPRKGIFPDPVEQSSTRAAENLTPNETGDVSDPISRAYTKILNVDAPPAQDDLDLVARTAPPGYRPGRGEQGDAGGEQSQDSPEGLS